MVVTASLTLVGFQGAEQTASAATKAPSLVTCTTANTKLTVSAVSRPINYLLLKATNTGTKPCYAYYAPDLRAGAWRPGPWCRGSGRACRRPWWCSSQASPHTQAS